MIAEGLLLIGNKTNGGDEVGLVGDGGVLLINLMALLYSPLLALFRLRNKELLLNIYCPLLTFLFFLPF